jgi:hypothetical protein
MKWRDRDFTHEDEVQASSSFRAMNIGGAVDMILREMRPLASIDPADLDPRIVAHLHRLLGHRLVESLLMPDWVHGADIHYSHAPNRTHHLHRWHISAASFTDGVRPLVGINRSEIGRGETWIDAVHDMCTTFPEGPGIPEWWWDEHQEPDED